MADIETEVAEWAGVRQIETGDDAIGGKDGLANAQALALIKRINFVRDNNVAISSLAAPEGAESVGFKQLGEGASVRSIQEKLRERVSVFDFGAIGDGVADDTAALSLAFSSGKKVFVPRPSAFYKTTATVNFTSQTTIDFQDELTEIRMVSGTGFVLKCDGGQVESFAMKQVRISGGTVSGGNPSTGEYNMNCDGGLHARGVYVVCLNNFHSKAFRKATARAALLENVFNFSIRDSRFNCGTSKDDKQGGGGLKVTISDGATWNITQVTLNNNLFQFNNGLGVEITRDGPTGSIDGLTIDNNGIGHNAMGGVGITSQQITACIISNNHIEGDGAFGVNVQASGCGVDIVSNKIQDAATAIVHNGFGTIRSNQITRASLSGDSTKTGIAIGASANLTIGVNDIDTTWITDASKRYTRAAGGRADFGVIQTTKENFAAFYSAYASVYQGCTLIQSNPDDFSQRILVAYGTAWYRMIPRFSGVITIGGATPNIGGGGQVFKTNNAGVTVMTAIPGGYIGQEIKVIFGDNNTSVDFTGTTLKGNNGSDWSPQANDFMDCVFDGTNWLCRVTEV